MVLALNRRGLIVESRGSGYRVAVGTVTVTCRDDELRAAESTGGRKRRRVEGGGGGEAPRRAAPEPDEAGGVRSSLDLHGLTVADAREALLRHLDAALLAGHASVEVVHGIGTGRVRAAVLKELARIEAVKHVRPHPSNPGVTIVHL